MSASSGGHSSSATVTNCGVRHSGRLQNVFGADAAEVYRKPDGTNNARNARVHVATYQTLDVDSEEGTANFLTTYYPENYFSHIVIDECHRSAWGKWSQVLTRNPDAVQIGLTATPRQLKITEQSKEAQADAQITADNIRHFGEPVYEYDMSQGIEDGYLAACEIVRRDIFLDDKGQSERETGVERGDLVGKRVTDAITGEPLTLVDIQPRYEAPSFEDRLLMPERVAQMSRDLFDYLLATGGPEQKTIIFCARDRHADDVAAAMNNLYADWCAKNGKAPPRSLRVQMHRCRWWGSVPRRSARGLTASLHRYHGGTPDHGCGRPLRAEHRLLQVRPLAHRLLPDGRTGHTP